MKRIRRFAAVILFLFGTAEAGFAAAVPVAVSPGEFSTAVLIASACPTFSWSHVEGAQSSELIVYALGEEGEHGDATRPVLRRSFAGSVQSWTPSLRDCLQPGGRYGWSVRAGGEWSEPSLFEVASAPSLDDVEQALALLQGYLTARGGSARTGVSPTGPQGGYRAQP